MEGKDWQARFRLSDRQPLPEWFWWLLICAIPIGPWYIELLGCILQRRRPVFQDPEWPGSGSIPANESAR